MGHSRQACALIRTCIRVICDLKKKLYLYFLNNLIDSICRSKAPENEEFYHAEYHGYVHKKFMIYFMHVKKVKAYTLSELF